eukprot:TRINITY_DN4286_c0_g1_i1.p1 TRINITY_DN4286_c0_g1~~TRINITY_DN4286_c0_g1_i1.p1  ORF type:complete len:147 (-),score=49.21 TRINITY_DN4286_c0_g1_i1:65-505(-)
MERNCTNELVQSAVIGGIVGGFAEGLNKTFERRAPLGATFRSIGTKAMGIGAVAAAFSFTSCTAASMRNKEDMKNGFIGGVGAGVVATFASQSVSAGVAVAVLGGVFTIGTQIARIGTSKQERELQEMKNQFEKLKQAQQAESEAE